MEEVAYFYFLLMTRRSYKINGIKTILLFEKNTLNQSTLVHPSNAKNSSIVSTSLN